MNEVYLYFVWLRITDEGSISEKSVWSTLWIISDLNWRSHLKVAKCMQIDLFCIFRENTHKQQLIQAKILYQCPSRNILDFVYGGSHFSTGVIFLRVRHVKNRSLWHFFYTWDTFFYGQGSFLYDEKWALGRFSTGVVIRRYTGSYVMLIASWKNGYQFFSYVYRNRKH